MDIPKGVDYETDTIFPCWYPRIQYQHPHNYVKPVIRCKCGKLTGIGLHAVHTDGTITASFYHKRGNVYPEDPEGCEFHEHIKLLDYDCGDFPSVPLT